MPSCEKKTPKITTTKAIAIYYAIYMDVNIKIYKFGPFLLSHTIILFPFIIGNMSNTQNHISNDELLPLRSLCPQWPKKEPENS